MYQNITNELYLFPALLVFNPPDISMYFALPGCH